MIDRSDATSADETPVFFPAGDRMLFGILTAPTIEPCGTAVVILAGGGTPLATNVNRLSVRLCRHLARFGFHTFRFDYHGVGESFGTSDSFHLGLPFVPDLVGAIDWLRTQGISRFALVGSCFGARTALSAAAVLDEVEAAVLMCPPVRDFEMGQRVATKIATELSVWDFVRRAATPTRISNLLRKEMRRSYARLGKEKVKRLFGSFNGDSKGARYEVSRGFLDPLSILVERSVPVSLIYGDADDFYVDFERARSGRLGDILNHPRARVTLDQLSGTIHGFIHITAQDEALSLVSQRLVSVQEALDR